MLIVIDNEVMSNQYEDGMKKLEIRGLRVIRYCLIMTMIIIAWKLYSDFYAVGMAQWYNIFFFAMYAVWEFFLFRFYNGYMTEYREAADLILSQLLTPFNSICVV